MNILSWFFVIVLAILWGFFFWMKATKSGRKWLKEL